MIKYKYDLHFEISAVELQHIHQHFVASLVILVFAEPLIHSCTWRDFFLTF